MDQTYGNKPWEEAFNSQLSYLPSGPMGTFLKEKTTRGAPPEELTQLWQRFIANEIDADEFKDAVKAMKKKQPASNMVLTA